jgi:hypothetical protein
VSEPFTIWIEAEHWGAGEWMPLDTNSDVTVTRADGSLWTATFFTFENVNSLRKKYQRSGECLSGRYVWSTNMIIVDRLTRESVESIVADLLSSGEFESAFDGPHPAV